MRRRNNTHFVTQQPKQIDRFKKRNPPRILFAQQVNYEMTFNNQNISNKSIEENSKNSSNSESQNSQKDKTLLETQLNQTMSQGLPKSQQIKQKIKQSEKNIQKKSIGQLKIDENKKQVIIIGESIQYQQKNKGFKKGMRRRYSHKYDMQYMTY